jgi:hypothetical protein
MSRPRFLADNDVDDAIIDGVVARGLGIEFGRVRDFRLDRATDDEVLAFAAQHEWIVLSHDVSSMTAAAYHRLRVGDPMNGLLLAHQRDPIGSTIDSLVVIWDGSDAERWIGVVQFLPF